MVCKMVASKLLGVVGIFLVVNYAACDEQCKATIRGRPRCPPLWSQWQDKCYKVHDAKVNWEEGKWKCVEMGGVMVVPHSNEELQQLGDKYSCNNFWIGCSDSEVEGSLVCLDGEGTIDVQNNNEEDEDCIKGTASGWKYEDCDDTSMVICQHPIPALLLL